MDDFVLVASLLVDNHHRMPNELIDYDADVVDDSSVLSLVPSIDNTSMPPMISKHVIELPIGYRKQDLFPYPTRLVHYFLDNVCNNDMMLVTKLIEKLGIYSNDKYNYYNQHRHHDPSYNKQVVLASTYEDGNDDTKSVVSNDYYGDDEDASTTTSDGNSYVSSFTSNNSNNIGSSASTNSRRNNNSGDSSSSGNFCGGGNDDDNKDDGNEDDDGSGDRNDNERSEGNDNEDGGTEGGNDNEDGREGGSENGSEGGTDGQERTYVCEIITSKRGKTFTYQCVYNCAGGKMFGTSRTRLEIVNLMDPHGLDGFWRKMGRNNHSKDCRDHHHDVCPVAQRERAPHLPAYTHLQEINLQYR